MNKPQLELSSVVHLAAMQKRPVFVVMMPETNGYIGKIPPHQKHYMTKRAAVKICDDFNFGTFGGKRKPETPATMVEYTIDEVAAATEA